MGRYILGVHKFWQKASLQCRCICKGENSDQVGWSVTEKEVSSVPLEEPGHCPSSRTWNVTECDLVNKNISLLWQQGSYEVSQGQNLCSRCVLAFELGQLLSHFVYGNAVKRRLLPYVYPATCAVFGHQLPMVISLLYFLSLLLLFLKFNKKQIVLLA